MTISTVETGIGLSHPMAQGCPPAWADVFGEDRFGVFSGIVVKGVECRMRYVAPGKFWMGSAEGEVGRQGDEAHHEVTLTKGYWLGETPVTQAFLEAVGFENQSFFRSPDLPVERISFSECREFLAALNHERPGFESRLPTEAEWEFACRARRDGGKDGPSTYAGNLKSTELEFAPILDAIAWYGGNSDQGFELAAGELPAWRAKNKLAQPRFGTHPVATKRSNAWGFFDMLGNVWEWCEDWYGVYPGGPQADPQGPSRGADRVLRGGSWWIPAPPPGRAAGQERAVEPQRRLRFPPRPRLGRSPTTQGRRRSGRTTERRRSRSGVFWRSGVRRTHPIKCVDPAVGVL